MRVIITGSRDWVEDQVKTFRIEEILDTLYDLSILLGQPLTVRHGACPTGADDIAHRWCEEGRKRNLLLVEEPFPADWDKYGKPAGPIRNKEMADKGAEMCVAFNKGDSEGTTGMMALARERNIPVFEVKWEDITT